AEVEEWSAERFGWDLTDLDITKVVWVKQFRKLSLPIFTLFVHFYLTTYSLKCEDNLLGLSRLLFF
ncbi:hypothetical protein, partial [Spirosoma jeollabukense]